MTKGRPLGAALPFGDKPPSVFSIVLLTAGVDEETLDKALDYRAMAKPHGS